MTNPDGSVRNVRINPDIENEERLTFRTQVQRFHFQSSARSAKKSNDFFGLICHQVRNAVCCIHKRDAMSNKTRSILKAIAVLLVLLAVLMELHVIIIPAIAIYKFWLVVIAFGMLLVGSK